MAIFWRTVLVAGSMRSSVPFSSEVSQTESSLAVMPPSLSAGPTERVAVILLVAGSTRASVAGLPQSGTHSVSKAKVRSEQGSSGNSILAASLLVRGSIRWTDFNLSLATQMAFAEMASQSGSPPRSNVAMGFKLANGTWTCITPGFSGDGEPGWSWETVASANARASARFLDGNIFLFRRYAGWKPNRLRGSLSAIGRVNKLFGEGWQVASAFLFATSSLRHREKRRRGCRRCKVGGRGLALLVGSR